MCNGRVGIKDKSGSMDAVSETFLATSHFRSATRVQHAHPSGTPLATAHLSITAVVNITEHIPVLTWLCLKVTPSNNISVLRTVLDNYS